MPIYRVDSINDTIAFTSSEDKGKLLSEYDLLFSPKEFTSFKIWFLDSIANAGI